MEGVLKKIKIQTGVVKRIAKEKTMYEKEAVTIRQQIEDMKASGKDEYDIRKRNEVLQESEMMGPDCERRLKTAIENLTNLVEENGELKDEEVYKVAKTLLAEVMN